MYEYLVELLQNLYQAKVGVYSIALHPADPYLRVNIDHVQVAAEISIKKVNIDQKSFSSHDGN